MALVGFTAQGTAIDDASQLGGGETVEVLAGQVEAEYVEIELDPAASPAAGVSTATAPDPPTPPQPVTRAFTGDVISHVAVADSARTSRGEYDFSPMFERVAPVIQAADLAICHLETPLDPESRTPRGFPRFSAPAEVADALVGPATTDARPHPITCWTMALPG